MQTLTWGLATYRGAWPGCDERENALQGDKRGAKLPPEPLFWGDSGSKNIVAKCTGNCSGLVDAQPFVFEINGSCEVVPPVD